MGVERVNADNLKAPAQTQALEYCVIQPGDTLSKIAQRYYGNAGEYNKIFDANREVIVDADRFIPGKKSVSQTEEKLLNKEVFLRSTLRWCRYRRLFFGPEQQCPLNCTGYIQPTVMIAHYQIRLEFQNTFF